MAHRLRVGERYLTVSRLPVQVAAVSATAILLQSLVSDNRILVPFGYPLARFNEEAPAFEMRSAPYSRRPKGAVIPVQMKPMKQLAPLIDAMLLRGGKTMTGILRELRRKASAACRGKDLKANIRARMHWFRRRGYMIDSDALERLNACSPHEGHAARAASPGAPRV